MVRLPIAVVVDDSLVIAEFILINLSITVSVFETITLIDAHRIKSTYFGKTRGYAQS